MIFTEKTVTCAVPKETMPPNFAEKTFVDSHKTVKFAKVFSLENFSLYSSKSMLSLVKGFWNVTYLPFLFLQLSKK